MKAPKCKTMEAVVTALALFEALARGKRLRRKKRSPTQKREQLGLFVARPSDPPPAPADDISPAVEEVFGP